MVTSARFWLGLTLLLILVAMIAFGVFMHLHGIVAAIQSVVADGSNGYTHHP